MADNNTTDQRIVAAANRCKDGTVVPGVRHYDSIMQGVFKHMPEGAARQSEQGFLDNACRFLTREQAWEVAEKAGQLLERAPTDGRGGMLLFGGCMVSDNNTTAESWETVWPAAAQADAQKVCDQAVEIARLRAALTDMLAGWKYISANHGDLYGVGWDRAQQAAEEALKHG